MHLYFMFTAVSYQMFFHWCSFMYPHWGFWNKPLDLTWLDLAWLVSRLHTDLRWGPEEIWGEVHTEKIWGEIHREESWGEVHTEEIWGEVHTEKIWGEVHKEQIWGEVHKEQIWGEVHKEKIWGEVQKRFEVRSRRDLRWGPEEIWGEIQKRV